MDLCWRVARMHRFPAGGRAPRVHRDISLVTLVRRTWTIVGVATFTLSSALAHAPQAASNPVGVWHGTSLCLVHPSACKDERVVYRITRMKAIDSVSIDAQKIVNGQEQDMGILACRLTTRRAQVTCTIPQG